MKRLIKTFALTLACINGVAFLATGPAGAEELLNPVCQTSPQALVCKENSKNQTPTDNSLYGPNGILTKIVRIISIILGIAAVIVIIIGGFQYTLASGNPQSVDKAKNTVLFAVIGLIIASAAQAVVIFVLNKL